MKLPSYPKVWALGHAACADLLKDPVLVQEKIDGSQFSFANVGGVLHVRSKGAEVFLDSPGMFKLGVQTVQDLFEKGLLEEDWVYRGEFLAKPKHNILTYDRVPKGNVILFDITTGLEEYLPYEEVQDEAWRLGLECVPNFGVRFVESMDALMHLLAEPSCLGGNREGLVFKNYARFGVDGKVLMAKYVTEKFKETHKREWKADGGLDIVETLIASLSTPARWNKAVQHLREAGKLEGSPRDIGPLIAEAKADVTLEEKDYICGKLWEHFRSRIERGSTRGLPEWYKQQLAEGAFDATH